MGSSSTAQHCVKTKDVKNYSYCCYAICATLIVRAGVMPWPKTEASNYHAQLGLPDKGRAIKELVVCWALPYLIPWVIERVTLQFTGRVYSRWRGDDL